MFDDNEPRPKAQIVLGEDLYDLSIDELSERIERLRAEISRVEAALAQKRKGLDTAAAIFGKS